MLRFAYHLRLKCVRYALFFSQLGTLSYWSLVLSLGMCVLRYKTELHRENFLWGGKKENNTNRQTQLVYFSPWSNFLLIFPCAPFPLSFKIEKKKEQRSSLCFYFSEERSFKVVYLEERTLPLYYHQHAIITKYIYQIMPLQKHKLLHSPAIFDVATIPFSPSTPPSFYMEQCIVLRVHRRSKTKKREHTSYFLLFFSKLK